MSPSQRPEPNCEHRRGGGKGRRKERTRVGQVADVKDAAQHVVKLALLAEVKAGDERGAQGAISGGLAGELEVPGVGSEDIITGSGEGIVDGIEGGVAVRGGQRGEREGGGLGGGGCRLGGGIGERHFVLCFLAPDLDVARCGNCVYKPKGRAENGP